MSITYEEALSTLQAMFAEPWTRETLDAVLRHQKGHMENTVDFILRHSNKDPQELVDQLKSGVNPDDTTISMDEELARQLARGSALRHTAVRNAGTAASNTTTTTTTGSQGRHGTPTTLPDDFLCIPGRTPTSTSSSILESDAALARMLQDELFSEELARNPDFAHLARGRSSTRYTGEQQQQGAARSARSNAHAHIQPPRLPGVPNSPNINIMNKISELGDTARKRLQLMAAQFNARTNAGTAGAAGAGVATGSPAAAERRGLLDDNNNNDHDDMELAARKDL